jgi:short-subunit dehydrogenase
MKDQKPMGGRITNNGSTSAHPPRPDSVAYTACKQAITGLTRSTALSGGKYDIACGQIDIGNALTEVTQRMQREVPQANGTVMVDWVMDVDNVACAVVFIATVTPEANVQFLTVMATKMPFCRARIDLGRAASKQCRPGSALGHAAVAADAARTKTPRSATARARRALGEVRIAADEMRKCAARIALPNAPWI